MAFKKLPVQFPQFPIRKFVDLAGAYKLFQDLVRAFETFRVTVASSFNALQTSDTWTPVLAGGTTPGTQGYATQIGTYIRIGDIVTAWFHIILSSFDGTTLGIMTITGLPVAAKSNGHNYSGYIGQSSLIDLNVAGGYYQLVVTVQPGTAVINIQEIGDNVSVANITEADIAGTARIVGSITYEAA